MPRIDHNFNDRNRLFGRFGLAHQHAQRATATISAKGSQRRTHGSASRLPSGSLSTIPTYSTPPPCSTCATATPVATTAPSRTHRRVRPVHARLSRNRWPTRCGSSSFQSIGFGSNSYTTTNIIIRVLTPHGSIIFADRAAYRGPKAGISCASASTIADTLITAGSHTGEDGVFNFTGGYMNGPLDNSAAPPLVASSLPEDCCSGLPDQFLCQPGTLPMRAWCTPADCTFRTTGKSVTG